TWHHLALVVDAASGRLIVDGTEVQTISWTGTPGQPTTTADFLMGHRPDSSSSFLGQIDEVSVWNQALTTNQIQALKNRPLAGNEPGLVSYWRLDESAGTTTADATGHGHTGTLLNGAARTASTAFLGDGSVHLVAAPGIPFLLRQYAV